MTPSTNFFSIAVLAGHPTKLSKYFSCTAGSELLSVFYDSEPPNSSKFFRYNLINCRTSFLSIFWSKSYSLFWFLINDLTSRKLLILRLP